MYSYTHRLTVLEYYNPYIARMRAVSTVKLISFLISHNKASSDRTVPLSSPSDPSHQQLIARKRL